MSTENIEDLLQLSRKLEKNHGVRAAASIVFEVLRGLCEKREFPEVNRFLMGNTFNVSSEVLLAFLSATYPYREDCRARRWIFHRLFMKAVNAEQRELLLQFF